MSSWRSLIPTYTTSRTDCIASTLASPTSNHIHIKDKHLLYAQIWIFIHNLQWLFVHRVRSEAFTRLSGSLGVPEGSELL